MLIFEDVIKYNNFFKNSSHFNALEIYFKIMMYYTSSAEMTLFEVYRKVFLSPITYLIDPYLFS